MKAQHPRPMRSSQESESLLPIGLRTCELNVSGLNIDRATPVPRKAQPSRKPTTDAQNRTGDRRQLRLSIPKKRKHHGKDTRTRNNWSEVEGPIVRGTRVF